MLLETEDYKNSAGTINEFFLKSIQLVLGWQKIRGIFSPLNQFFQGKGKIKSCQTQEISLDQYWKDMSSD